MDDGVTGSAGPIDVGSTVLGRYEVLARLGAGGHGIVWRAWDPVLGREVALKHVVLARPDDDADARAQRRERTMREGQALGRLASPTVVAIHDMVAEGDDAVWLVLEHVPGRSLAEAIGTAGRLDPVQVGRIGMALARALDHGHRRDLIHRDVKPANVLVSDDGSIKLADYGIARFLDRARVTATDRQVGSVAWASPEWARGEPVTPASDVFSLGATLFHAVEGHPPFGDDTNAMRVLGLVALGRTTPPRHAGALGPVISSMLAVRPEDRPDAATAADLLAEALGRTVDDESGPPLEPHRVPEPDTVPRAAPDAPTGVPGGPVPTGRQRRPGARWAVVGAVVTVLVLAAVAVLVVLSPGSGAPAEDPLTLPATLVPIDVTGDQRDIDPCALVDPGPLAVFGTPRPALPGPDLSGCTLPIARQGTSRVAVVADLASGNGTAGITGARQPIGAGFVVHQGGDPTNCRTTVTLAGDGQIALQGRSDDPGLDACRLVEAATALTVRGLNAHGLVSRPGRTTRWELGAVDACTLPSAAALDGVGLGALVDAPDKRGWARWDCSWGRADPGRPQATLSFALEDEAEVQGRGDSQLVDGRTVITGLDGGEDNPRSCRADLLWRPTTDPPGLFQILRADVEATRPDGQLCATAVRMVDEGARRLR